MENDLNKIYRDMNLLAPKVSEKALDAIAECRSLGFMVDVFETWRSMPRQQMLYEKGRSKPGKRVTDSLPGFSMHHYGLAVDIALRDVKGQWSWDGPWDKIGAIFIAHDFDVPPSFEKCHFQMSNHNSVSQIRSMAEINTVQGLWVIMDLI